MEIDIYNSDLWKMFYLDLAVLFKHVVEKTDTDLFTQFILLVVNISFKNFQGLGMVLVLGYTLVNKIHNVLLPCGLYSLVRDTGKKQTKKKPNKCIITTI